MAPLTPNASADSSNESPPPPSHHHRSKSATEIQRAAARLTFNKTIEGRYRHGKTGYRQVGALFLTWKDDDMQCKETEVGIPGAGLKMTTGSRLATRWTN